MRVCGKIEPHREFIVGTLQRTQWAHFDQIDGHIVKELKGFFHKMPSGYIVVRATLHPDAPAALELSIACTMVLDYL